MKNVNRRDFLKTMGVTSTLAVGFPIKSYHQLFPFFNPPHDIHPGDPTWYATTCRECPAGCGMLVKNLDGRVIKAEGNPVHPVNRGALCPRGQASLQGIYNPDRIVQPARRTDKGLKTVDWDEAQRLMLEAVEDHGGTKNARVVFLTELVTGSTRELIEHWIAMFESGEHVMYESLAYEPLRTANKIVFGTDAIPHYRMEAADFLISFGAGFLETWLSNVEYARSFTLFHTPDQNGKGKHPFVYVGPRRSMTAANADKYVAVAPGDEYLVAIAILKVVLNERKDSEAVSAAMLPALTIEEIATRTGVDSESIRKIGRKFAQAEHPLALADGLSYSSPHALDTAVAANLLCAANPGAGSLLDFSAKFALSETARAEKMKNLTEKMRDGDVDILLVHDANPLFTLPPSWEFQKALSQVPAIVGFSSFPDETTQGAHLFLPSNTPLESWGEYAPRTGIRGLMQPVMGTVFSTRQIEDILISTGRELAGKDRFPWPSFHALLMEQWKASIATGEKGETPAFFWLKTLQKGGLWDAGTSENERKTKTDKVKAIDFQFPAPERPSGESENAYHFTTYPTIQFFDGRMANRPWIQELPDPISQTTWGAWLEMHPDTAKKIGVEKGDMLRLTSAYGSVEVPLLPIFSVPPGTIAMPLGQGHDFYGRYAAGLPANPLRLFSNGIDRKTGGLKRPPISVTIENLGRKFPIAHTDGSFFEHDRELVTTVSYEVYKTHLNENHKPEIDLPLPEGYNPREDFYDPHPPVAYRWCMVLDMDRCIGCGACVVACYAENNLAVVGREQVLNGREMSWIMVQRYFEKKKPHDVRYLVMLCQHCTEAPCESVCPVFAPQHSPEGLNNQVYNRCIGTRDCSQNDPYKVRRFNFFTYRHPSPLDWQLNPDVTVRQKGVMEKCSFCIQRIVNAKIRAKTLGRKVQDDDFTTACAQTCPTNALIFGSLLNPDSRVSKLIHDPRAHQILKDLNTKPAAVYLKKITLEI